MRLIDAGALMAEMHNIVLEDGEDRRIVYEVIERQPIVDPVKHGRWIDATKEIGWPIWKCSVCGGNGRGDYFVCPWCGAKMDEVER